MTSINNHSEYVSLVNTLKVYDYQYFTLNAPTITDAEYDRLYFLAQDYEQRTGDVLPDSPTQQCYSVNGNGKKTVARRTACLSMNKIHNSLDMLKYLRRQMQAARVSEAQIDVEWKFDGDTAALVYQRGILTEATYGHSKDLWGNDCLAAISFVQGVPHSVLAWHDIDRVEVRGEVIINNEEYARYTKRGKSQRSTSSGIMAKKYPIASECERLEFHPFRAIMTTDYADYTESHKVAMQVLSAYGFMTSGPVAQFSLTANDSSIEQEIESIVSEAENNRDALPFPTDGLVFKFDDYTLYDLIGITDHDGKYNCAFKFRPIYKAETVYRGFHTSIGEKAGNITYIADFDEVTLNGARYSTSSCGSEKTFMKKNLTPGDRIMVSIHGDAGAAFIDGKVNTPQEQNNEEQNNGQPDTTDSEAQEAPVCCATSRTMEPEEPTPSEAQEAAPVLNGSAVEPTEEPTPSEAQEAAPVSEASASDSTEETTPSIIDEDYEEDTPDPLVIQEQEITEISTPSIQRPVAEPTPQSEHQYMQLPPSLQEGGQRGAAEIAALVARQRQLLHPDYDPEDSERDLRAHSTGNSLSPATKATLALCAIVIVGGLAVASMGAALFLLPLLGGAFAKA